MVDLIRFLRRSSPKVTVNSVVDEGFVYVSEDDQSPLFKSIAPNIRIGGINDRPPWIVVDHSPQSIILAEWPGRLWKVQILRRASEQPYAYAGYTRATEVNVLCQVPLGELFEHNGAAVVRFLNQVSQLTEKQVEWLSRELDEDAALVHNLAWDRWLSLTDPTSHFLGNNHAGTIAVGSKTPRSPVGNAPSVLYTQLTKRAREMAGDDAFVTDDEEVYLSPTWTMVAANLQHGLFAIGVGEQLVSKTERVLLARVCSAAFPCDDA